MNFVDKRVAPADAEAVTTWEAPDRTTVVAHCGIPRCEMESLWIYILPKHVWQGADTDEVEAHSRRRCRSSARARTPSRAGIRTGRR